jgi:hypothetical protein
MHPDVKFSKVVLRDNSFGGIRFECARCRYQVPHSLFPGQQIQHCGRVDIVPELKKVKDEHRIGPAGGFPSNIYPVGDWS